MMRPINNQELYNLNHCRATATQLTNKTDHLQPKTANNKLISKLRNVCNTFKKTKVKREKINNHPRSSNFLSHVARKLRRIFNLTGRTTHSNAYQSKTTGKFYRHPPISNKQIRVFIDKKIAELDIVSKGLSDIDYADQTIDSILASVYSEQKDAFCVHQVTHNRQIPINYLREIGERARENGLIGQEKAGIFKLAGAGANPFLTAVMGAVLKKFPNRTITASQELRLKNYAKQKIYQEVTKVCLARNRVEPQEFDSQLSTIANKYNNINHPIATENRQPKLSLSPPR